MAVRHSAARCPPAPLKRLHGRKRCVMRPACQHARNPATAYHSAHGLRVKLPTLSQISYCKKRSHAGMLLLALQPFTVEHAFSCYNARVQPCVQQAFASEQGLRCIEGTPVEGSSDLEFIQSSLRSCTKRRKNCPGSDQEFARFPAFWRGPRLRSDYLAPTRIPRPVSRAAWWSRTSSASNHCGNQRASAPKCDRVSATTNAANSADRCMAFCFRVIASSKLNQELVPGVGQASRLRVAT